MVGFWSLHTYAHINMNSHIHTSDAYIHIHECTQKNGTN